MNKKQWLAGPYVVWMIIFTVVPLCVVAYYALTDSITGEFTLKNLANVGNYLPIFLRSVGLSLVSSAICLVVGYPVAYCIARSKPSTQRLLYLLVMTLGNTCGGVIIPLCRMAKRRAEAN